MPPRSSTSARVLAPVALVACAVLLFLAIATSGGGDGSESREKVNGSQKQSTQSSRSPRRTAPRPRGGTYTVKAGDTLGDIAEKTGVEIEQLQELNPQLDPQSLASGQKLKLRE
ncbi:MAG: LysM peptidoglycan-binding domain-containing protein [Actinomycetota bacterium]|nr:LysM peptidoglycan-binding domain-containing protein [Actinomycetota bacterium]